MRGYNTFIYFRGDKGYIQPKHDYLSISCGLPYKDIRLFIGSHGIEEYKESKKRLKEGLYHEAFHVVVSKYAKVARSRYCSLEQIEDEEETLVDHLTNIIIKIKNDK
jgi:hypothetical protein